jgi:Arm domain-containing DNA-binding protein
MPLTDEGVQKAAALNKPYKLFDARGLHLLVMPEGGKWWRFRYRFGGRAKTLSMGVYPDVSLKEARVRRDAARRILAQRIDPGVIRREEKAREKAERLALKDSGMVSVCVSLDGIVEVWKGHGVLRLARDEAIRVRDLLTKFLA